MSPETSSVLAQLMGVIESRRDNPPERSYTTSLFTGGVGKIGGKISEEAAEVVEAAAEPDEPGRTHLVHEAADLVYHLLVMMAHRGVTFDQLEAELAGRFGVSGLDEKAARRQLDQSNSTQPGSTQPGSTQSGSTDGKNT